MYLLYRFATPGMSDSGWTALLTRTEALGVEVLLFSVQVFRRIVSFWKVKLCDEFSGYHDASDMRRRQVSNAELR